MNPEGIYTKTPDILLVKHKTMKGGSILNRFVRLKVVRTTQESSLNLSWDDLNGVCMEIVVGFILTS